MKLQALATLLLSLSFSAHAFATPEDCAFCKKDHKTICESECMDESAQYGKGDRCQPKCVDVKCKSACGDKVKADHKKSDKASDTKAGATPKG